MATKTWKADTIQQDLVNGRENISYSVNGEDGEYKFTTTGNVAFTELHTIDDSLVEETVIDWVKEKLDADNAGTVASIEADVEKSVNDQKNN
tara:strand:- start:22 stop:297 length:276 start_codon:yes stop_codon:yes gene_type:complete